MEHAPLVGIYEKVIIFFIIYYFGKVNASFFFQRERYIILIT